MRIHHLILSCLLLSLLITAGCQPERDPITSAADLENYRVELREQVASGKLTEAEAVVAIAEATKELKFGNKKRQRPKSKKMEALGNKLKEQVTDGTLTMEEAAAKWAEARSGGKNKKSKAPDKEEKQP